MGDWREKADEAGARALYRLLGWVVKPDWHSGDAEHVQAHAVIAAAEPIIRADEQRGMYARYMVDRDAWEAEVRERIAQAIEAHAEKIGAADPPPQQDDYYAALHDAAAIARRSGDAGREEEKP